MADEPDYYALLGIPPTADLAMIRLAFRRLARLYHPDVAGTGSLERMQQLNAAYRVLSDPAARQLYDMQHQHTPAASARPAGSQAAPDKRSGVVDSQGNTFRRMQTLASTETTPIAAVAFSAEGIFLAVGLLDGQVQLWDTRLARLIQTCSFRGMDSGTNGVLQEVRLSPHGTLAMAWGFQLGTRVWNVQTGKSLWHIGAYGPSGAVDAVIFDTPDWVRLALPDAPLAISEEDPFRWAHEGRQSSSILTRPLAAPVDPAWAIPLHCPEVPQGKRGAATSQQTRIQQRLLSADGRSLLTISTNRRASLPYSRLFRLWEVDHRTVRGAVAPRDIALVEQPLDFLQYPIAVTPDLTLACANFQGRELRIFSLHTGSVLCSIAAQDFGTQLEQAQISLSPDGRFLTIQLGTRLDLFALPQGQRIQQWRFAAPITALAFAPHRQQMMLSIALQNGLTELWSV